MSKTDQILLGLKEQNKPAEFEGRKGFWVQADAVFIEAENPTWAINNYRDELSRGKIGCSHNHFCDAIQRLRYIKELTAEQWQKIRNQIL